MLAAKVAYFFDDTCHFAMIETMKKIAVKEKEVALTPKQEKALIRAKKNLRKGKTLSLRELKKRLGFTD